MGRADLAVFGEAWVGYRLRKGFHLPPLMFDMDERHTRQATRDD